MAIQRERRTSLDAGLRRCLHWESNMSLPPGNWNLVVLTNVYSKERMIFIDVAVKFHKCTDKQQIISVY